MNKVGNFDNLLKKADICYLVIILSKT